MPETLLYRGGLPYSPDRRRLNEAFPMPALTEGRVISHEELGDAVNCNSKSSRYYAVINSWISHQESENGILMRWEHNIGLKVMNPADVLSYAETKTRQKLKQAVKAIRIFGKVDRKRLDTVGQDRLDHQVRVVNAYKESADAARKQLAVDLAPVKSLPKPKLVREA